MVAITTRSRSAARASAPRAVTAIGASSALLGGAAEAPAASTTTMVSAADATTTATFSYRVSGDQLAPYRELRLTITRGGRVGCSGRPAAPCASLCWPDVHPGHRFLRVADIERDGSPDVVLDLYTGGAHCCSIVEIFRYDAARGTYAAVSRDFRDPGAALERLGGAEEFVSADDHFAYAFTSFAYSGLPLQIWSFDGGGFRDVTRSFPALIEHDAAGWHSNYLANRGQGFGLGAIAAWAADEDLLGKSTLVSRTLAVQNRLGELRSGDGLAPHGSAFIVALQRFLVRHGYARPS